MLYKASSKEASCLLFKGHFQMVPFTLMEVPTIKGYFCKIYCRMTPPSRVLNDSTGATSKNVLKLG